MYEDLNEIYADYLLLTSDRCALLFQPFKFSTIHVFKFSKISDLFGGSISITLFLKYLC